jgi:hypothetical protein
MTRIALLLLLSLSLIGCKKDYSDELKGLYAEVSPVAGRTQLQFLAKGVLIKSEKGSNTQDVFRYKINNGKIELRLLQAIEGEVSYLDFKVIDEKTFEIENLFISIPESPKILMVFKR